MDKEDTIFIDSNTMAGPTNTIVIGELQNHFLKYG
jgi:hypothetical protein